MKRILPYVAAIMLVFILASETSFACTSVVVSGRVTPDGRPLLWKHRDSDFFQNAIKFFKGEKYSYFGVVNSADKNPDEIWIGTNSAGFSIMNTQSFNLEPSVPEAEKGPANGRVMKRALEVCATVEDFCRFLDTLSKPSGLEANLGVIDAKGGAVMIEVGYYGYKVYDANDPAVAPFGYVARTNFSFSGEIHTGYGYVRYQNEERLLTPAAGKGILTPEWILQEVARSFENPLMGIDLESGMYNPPYTSGWFVDHDLISRRSSCSSVVIQGVKDGESPELTVMWTILGYPPTGVAVPLLLKGADRLLPAMVLRDNKTGVAAVCDHSQTLADRVYSYSQGSGTDRYFNWDALFNASGKGYMQQLVELEHSIFKTSEPVIEGWRKAGKVDVKELELMYGKIENAVLEKYGTLLGD